MKVQLRLFATLRERLGTVEREIDVPRGTSAREIFLGLFEDRKTAKRLLPSTRFAVNCEYVPPETAVQEGDELAFIPPVSGG